MFFQAEHGCVWLSAISKITVLMACLKINAHVTVSEKLIKYHGLSQRLVKSTCSLSHFLYRAPLITWEHCHSFNRVIHHSSMAVPVWIKVCMAPVRWPWSLHMKSISQNSQHEPADRGKLHMQNLCASHFHGNKSDWANSLYNLTCKSRFHWQREKWWHANRDEKTISLRDTIQTNVSN